MDYVSEVKYAIKNLLGLIYHEHDELSALGNALANVEDKLAHLYSVSDFLRLNPDLDDEGIGTPAHWEAYFDVEPQHIAIRERVDEVQGRIDARVNARAALAGSILQISKQDLSLIHGGLNGPAGRSIGSQSLRDVLWHGRNQSMHYEEGKIKASTRECFEKIYEDYGDKSFKDYNKRNLAFEIIDLFGWKDYLSFEKDMEDLLKFTPPIDKGCSAS